MLMYESLNSLQYMLDNITKFVTKHGLESEELKILSVGTSYINDVWANSITLLDRAQREYTIYSPCYSEDKDTMLF